MKLGVVFVSLLLLTACTSPEGVPPDVIASVEATRSEPAHSSSRVRGSPEPPAGTSPSPAKTFEPAHQCDGLGVVPANGQITFLENGRLMASAPSGKEPDCLLAVGELSKTFLPPIWNALAERVLIGNRALSGDGSLTQRLTEWNDDPPRWSRPTGTSVVYVSDDGLLMKRSSHGGDPFNISFLGRHDDVTYHPAGEHIATSGLTRDGNYGLYLATNIGGEPQLLARGEAARFISNLHFSQDGRWLYYTARHGPQEWHLHRLKIGQDAQLETLAKGHANFEYSVSPFDPDAYAWFLPGDCAAGKNGRFKASGRRLRMSDAMLTRNIHPVGWLPSHKLIVRAATTGCSTAQPGDVYVLSRNDQPTLIEEENYGNVSVRVAMPPPPPPPKKEQEAVA